MTSIISVASLRATVFALSASVFMSGAWGQDECTGLAKTLLSIQKFESQEATYAAQRGEFCIKRYNEASSSEKGAIEGAYEGISGSGDYSAARITKIQDEHCESKFGLYWRQFAQKQYKVSASSDALQTVNMCLQLRSAGLRLSVATIPSKGEYTVIALWDPQVPSTLKASYFGPTVVGEQRCTAIVGTRAAQSAPNASAFGPFDLATKEAVSITCVRQVDVKEASGISQSCAAAEGFLVHMQGKAETLTIPKRCDEAILPKSRAAALEQRAAALEKRTTSLEADLAAANRLRADEKAASDGKIAALESRPRIKHGNNGTVSCDLFCAGRQWHDFSAACIIGYRRGAIAPSGVPCNYTDGQDRTPAGWGYSCICGTR